MSLSTFVPGVPGIALAMALSGAIAPAAAAEPADSTRARSSGAVITEVGVHTAITRSRENIDAFCLTVDVGYLRRTGGRTMVGLDVSFTAHDAGSFWAIQPRMRRELENGWAVDVAVGPVVAGTAESANVDGLGISAVGEIHYRGFVGLTLGFDSVKYNNAYAYYGPNSGYESGYVGTVTTTHIGVRVGKGPGIAAAAILFVAGLAAVASLAN